MCNPEVKVDTNPEGVAAVKKEKGRSYSYKARPHQ